MLSAGRQTVALIEPYEEYISRRLIYYAYSNMLRGLKTIATFHSAHTHFIMLCIMRKLPRDHSWMMLKKFDSCLNDYYGSLSPIESTADNERRGSQETTGGLRHVCLRGDHDFLKYDIRYFYLLY